MTARRFRLSSLATLAAALMATCLLRGPTPARASDFTDCMEALGGAAWAVGPGAVIDTAKDPEVLTCASLVEDPEFDALVAALVALKSKYNTVDDCKGLLPELLEQVASNSGVAASTVEAEWGCACRVAVDGFGAFKKAANAIGNVANSCGALAEDAYCSTFGGTDDDCMDMPETPPAPKQDAACEQPSPKTCVCDQTAHKTKALLDLEACMNRTEPFAQYSNCIMPHQNDVKYGFDQWDPRSELCVKYETGQTYPPLYCNPGLDPNQSSCGRGSQCGVNNAWLAWYNGNRWKPFGPQGPQNARSWSLCVSCDTVTNGAATGDGVCGCKNGYLPVYGTGLSGKKTLLSCSCPAPMQEGSRFGPEKSCGCPVFGQVPRMVRGKLICACPVDQQLDNGLCRSCSGSEVYNPDTLSCEHLTRPPKGESHERFQPPAPSFQTPPAPLLRPGMGPGRQRPPTMVPPQRARPNAPPQPRPMQRFRPPFRPIEPLR